MAQFRYLKYGLSIVLGFIGAKMLIEPFYDIHILVSLIVIFVVILVSVLASLLPTRSSSASEKP
jgi:tellurite resistance protein TerC